MMPNEILDENLHEVPKTKKESPPPQYSYLFMFFVLNGLSWGFIRFYYTKNIQAFKVSGIVMFSELAMFHISIFAHCVYLLVAKKFNPSYWKFLKESYLKQPLANKVLLPFWSLVFFPGIILFGFVCFPIAHLFQYTFGFSELVSVDIAFIIIAFGTFFGIYKVA